MSTRRLKIPLLPMEATTVDEIPVGREWQYEPKWDGFRCVAFRRGSRITLQSKSGKPLTRYFPEVAAELAKLKATDFALDGEIVIAVGKHLSFNDLLMRIHPAASRVRTLSEETPATYIVFDMLENESASIIDQPLERRRKQLEAFAKKEFKRAKRIELSPATRDVKIARKWFKSAGKALDGIIAKRADFGYRSDDRSGMQKIKKQRTVDCVVGGFRYGTNSKLVGSLLLGLYDKEGLLNHVGFTSGIARAEKAALTKKLEKLIGPPGFSGKAPGGPSRWSTERSTKWEPLKPKLVVEVEYDHFTGGRFRHGTKLLRWRPDKSPRQCKMEQVSQAGARASF
ncbi:MAG TPA: ATP-dependent DNA ligase [Lacipirellulaceae bacterium]|jgi:ATP-dependent DNA ligase|nr:ATP-dependent DNA ligase [Lacipirellulaceae bacterium]